jgi:predicted helicase
MIDYRPFDKKYIYFESNFIERDRSDVVQHFQKGKNLNLIFSRQSTEDYWSNIQISKEMIDNRFHFSYKGIPNQAPLYLYPEESTQQTLDGQPERTPNLDKKILGEIANKLGLKFIPEKDDTEGTFAPIDLLDYIYAVLHSPSYREKYKEFLKIDFPRVPYPEDPELFWLLLELGGELRKIHLLEHPVVEDFITTYPESGTNIISNRLTKNDPGFIPNEDDDSTGKVWINDKQYFGNMPKKAWEFYIGGYQPAEKWLKDRRDRELSIEEIQHYQKIIVALMETDRIMGKIDGVFDKQNNEK